ncbi:hypothetical protein D9M68_238840 [compost metagenome]
MPLLFLRIPTHNSCASAPRSSDLLRETSPFMAGSERSAAERRHSHVRMSGMILVYRYRVKSLNGLLNKQSRAVNYVWNFCNDTQKHALKWGKKTISS